MSSEKVRDLEAANVMVSDFFRASKDLEALKDDFKGILNGMKEETKSMKVEGVLNHEPCNDGNCGICGLKKNISTQAYKRGLIGGIKLHTKYPKVQFGV